MPRFIMIYKGEATDTADMTEEQAREVMAKWGAWMEKVGPALSDVGTPFGAGVSVIDNGTTSAPVPLSGYSIVEAPDLAAAQHLADGHPYLSEGSGNFAIEIYEMMPVPFEA
ncbi:MAG: YciI family protein [Acidimicrobiia bacterium]